MREREGAPQGPEAEPRGTGAARHGAKRRPAGPYPRPLQMPIIPNEGNRFAKRKKYAILVPYADILARIRKRSPEKGEEYGRKHQRDD